VRFDAPPADRIMPTALALRPNPIKPTFVKDLAWIGRCRLLGSAKFRRLVALKGKNPDHVIDTLEVAPAGTSQRRETSMTVNRWGQSLAVGWRSVSAGGRESGHRIRTIVGTGLLAILTSTAYASRAEKLDTWPRQVKLPDAVVVVYQPHVDAWGRNRLAFCAAVEARTTGSGDEAFGVIWGIARTTVDRTAGRVTLSQLRLTRSIFPALLDNGAAHLRESQKQLKGVTLAIPLDRLEASFAESRHYQAGGSPAGTRRPRHLQPPIWASTAEFAGLPHRLLRAELTREGGRTIGFVLPGFFSPVGP